MKINKFSFLNVYRILSYDNTDANNPDTSGTKTGDDAGAEGDTSGGSGDGSGANGDSDEKTLSQKEVNRIVAEDRRKHQEKIKSTVKELENLKASKNLTEKEKSDLQKRIEDLQGEVLTKEQLAAKEKERLKSSFAKQLEEANAERDLWKNRFTHSTINQQLTSAAVKNEAYDEDQIIALLKPTTSLVEEMGEDQNPTGNLVPKVKFEDLDEQGKKVTLNLTPEEAVKRMKDMSKFANLFKSTAAGGVGGGQSGARGTRTGPIKDPAEYRKHRKTIAG